MIAYIPMAIGHILKQEIYHSLSAQNVVCGIVPCCMPGVLKINGNYLNQDDKVVGEVLSRNLALDLMLQNEKEPFAIMQDNDIVHHYGNNYQRAIERIQSNENIAMVALPSTTEWNKYHIKISAMVLRVSAFKMIRFRADSRMHTCITLQEDIQALKFTCGYLSSVEKLVHEL